MKLRVSELEDGYEDIVQISAQGDKGIKSLEKG
jgi:hypothetical protein